MRRGVEEALRLVEEGNYRLVLEFPTGYGKSMGGASIYRLVNELGLPEGRVVHVLPLRAVVEDLAVRMRRELGGVVAYQAGTHIQLPDGSPLPKSPLFDGGYNITTLDSFAHNLFKVPITEVFRERKHYYIPFERIYTSTVILDEAHLMAGSGDPGVRAAFLESLRCLSGANSPIIIMTATLTENLRSSIRRVLPGVRFLRLGDRDGVVGDTIYIRDAGFEEEMRSTRYIVGRINMNEVVGKALELVKKKGRKVLIIINNISKIVEIYRQLVSAGVRAGLIHGRLTRRDRARVMERLGELEVLIGTSAIEAGVDASFDALITVPDDPAGLVQRVGRVCRRGGDCTGELYLVCDGDGAVKKLCGYALSRNIQWRLPYDVGGVSYTKILEESDASPGGLGATPLAYLCRPYVRQDVLRAFLEWKGYSLVRGPLVDVYVRGLGEFKNAREVDVILDSYTLSVSEVWGIINCVEGVGYIDKNGNPALSDFDPRRFVDKPVSAYASFARRYEAAPVLITRPGCYEGG